MDALQTIYTSILSQHLNINGFPAPVQKYSTLLVNGALALHARISSNFLPTAIKFHYVFNLRDLSNIFQVSQILIFVSNNCFCGISFWSLEEKKGWVFFTVVLQTLQHPIGERFDILYSKLMENFIQRKTFDNVANIFTRLSKIICCIERLLSLSTNFDSGKVLSNMLALTLFLFWNYIFFKLSKKYYRIATPRNEL